MSKKRKRYRFFEVLLFLLIGAFFFLLFYGWGVHFIGKGASPDREKPEGEAPLEQDMSFGDTSSPAKPAEVEGLEIRADHGFLPPGGEEKLTLVATFADQRQEQIDSEGINYEMMDPNLGSIRKGGIVRVSPEAKTGDVLTVKAAYKGKIAEIQLMVRYSLEDTIKVDQTGKAVVTNLDDPVILVNKERNLPNDYIPSDLVPLKIPFSFQGESPKKSLRKEAAEALEALFKKAAEEDMNLTGVSGFRSYSMQKSIYENKIKTMGEEAAGRISAFPGQSEHQTGLAIDISSTSVGNRLVENFGETKEGKWLAEHAPDFGFIIRYPKGKEEITGYSYEPWHIRYVGVNVAKEIAKRKITLDEFFALDTFETTQ
ncbi:putative Serine-type D-Ala-D-Ala carboxypeptidase [[Clostridium] ultunense Esp]|nr:putative Serine-type D-Ala-D-Ala carboxypeptidase [[Clostridium] ultunense Esp]